MYGSCKAPRLNQPSNKALFSVMHTLSCTSASWWLQPNLEIGLLYVDCFCLKFHYISKYEIQAASCDLYNSGPDKVHQLHFFSLQPNYYLHNKPIMNLSPPPPSVFSVHLQAQCPDLPINHRVVMNAPSRKTPDSRPPRRWLTTPSMKTGWRYSLPC